MPRKKKNVEEQIENQVEEQATEKRKYERKTPEQKIADIDQEIADTKDKIEKLKKKVKDLEKRKSEILNPKPKKVTKAKMNELISLATKSGMTEEEIAEKLGITLEK